MKKEAQVTVGGKTATEWTLKNGVKVVVLPTDYKKDQVIMNFQKNGGRSLIATEDLPSFEDNVFALFMRNTGLSKFSGTTLSKMLAGKNVSTSVYVGNIRHGVSVNSSPKDLETAFQLLYLTVAEPRFDQDEFQTGIEQLKAILPNMLNTPDFRLQQEMVKTLYGNNPRQSVIDMETLGKANIETLKRVYTEQLFKDAAGATLYVVGNVQTDSLKTLVEKYVGSLPKGKKAAGWNETGEHIVKGKVENHFTTGMETPKSSVLQVYTAYIPYSVKEEVMLDAAKYVLDMIYTDTLREEEGGTYGASVSFSLQDKPKDRAMIQIYFDTNPEAADKLRKSASDGLNKLMTEGPTEEQLAMTIENFKKNIPESRISNSYWMGNIVYFEEYGVDFDKEYEAAIEDINAENVKKAVKDIVSQGNFIEIMMSPADAE